jgi:hypothetical protein
MDICFNRGLDEPGGGVWASGTWKFLLLKGSGYTVNRDHDFVADLTPGSNETALSGYSRQTAGSKTRTIDDTNDRITYDCADPAFGSIAAGDTISAMVLFRFVTNDSDSILAGYYDITDTVTNGSPFTVTLGAAGTSYIDQGA